MKYTILNLGAGVQSTCVYLMARDGEIDPVDYAIFGDTQEEPEAVYQHLAWLQALPPPHPRFWSEPMANWEIIYWLASAATTRN